MRCGSSGAIGSSDLVVVDLRLVTFCFDFLVSRSVVSQRLRFSILLASVITLFMRVLSRINEDDEQCVSGADGQGGT